MGAGKPWTCLEGQIKSIVKNEVILKLNQLSTPATEHCVVTSASLNGLRGKPRIPTKFLHFTSKLILLNGRTKIVEWCINTWCQEWSYPTIGFVEAVLPSTLSNSTILSKPILIFTFLPTNFSYPFPTSPIPILLYSSRPSSKFVSTFPKTDPLSSLSAACQKLNQPFSQVSRNFPKNWSKFLTFMVQEFSPRLSWRN